MHSAILAPMYAVCLLILFSLVSSKRAQEDDFENFVKASKDMSRNLNKGVSKSSTSNRQLLKSDVCARECNWWSCATYSCPSSKCCMPGSSASDCCPYSKPVCVENGCCPQNYPKKCGKRSCCKETAECCLGDVNKLECCDDDQTYCCGAALGCRVLCESIFDAVPCTSQLPWLTKINTDNHRYWRALWSKRSLSFVYRVLRPTENPNYLLAKNPFANEPMTRHVLCGSQPNFTSQYMSFTASLDTAKTWYDKASTSGGIVRVRIEDLPVTAIYYDFTSDAIRQEHLTKSKARYLSRNMNEVLIWLPPFTAVAGELIEGPKDTTNTN